MLCYVIVCGTVCEGDLKKGGFSAGKVFTRVSCEEEVKLYDGCQFL